MFQLVQGHYFFQGAGLLLLMVQLCLFVFGLPPFHIGIWLQTEPDMVAMFTLGMLNAVWLLYGVVSRALVQQRTPLLLYVLLGWVAWQIVATMFAFTPYRSWFGPVEMGEGVAWHLSLLLIVLVALPLWQDPRYRKIVLVWAACVIALESLMHILFNRRENVYIPGSWSPAQWGAYLAFMMGYFWVALMASGYVRTLRSWVILVVFTAEIFFVSYNKSAIALLPFALVGSFGVYLWFHRKGMEVPAPSRRMRFTMVAMCFLPLGWIFFSATYVPPENVHPDSYKSLSNLSHKNGALGSRVALIQVGVEAMKYEPRRWLVGNGWGEYTDSIFRYSLLPGVHMFENGDRKPNWQFVDGNAYHSHCQPLEALLALGLPGMLLWFAVPVVMLLRMPSRMFWSAAPMILLLNTVGFLWFQLPQCVPMQGLMLAAMCHVSQQPQVQQKQRRWVVSFCFFVVSLVMALTALQQNDSMMYGERLYKGPRYLGLENYPVEMMAMDMLRGGDHLRVSASGFAMSLDKENGDFDKRQHDWYAHFMRMGQLMSGSARIGPRGRYMELWLQYKLLLNLGYPIFSDLGHQTVKNIRKTVTDMARIAPQRDDIASIYFMNIDSMTHGDKAVQEQVYRDILAIVPQHRPALWLLGNLLIEQKKSKAEGEAMIRKAVALRVQDVYGVLDKELKPWLEKAE